ncbi:hypothetical protein HDV05_006997 [Chytridiales sp. JEL 0842]|nr:hypothetical protein HDV05_006997 [Chytridiales sp. JEL 0842]
MDLAKDLEKVTKRQKTTADHTNDKLDKIINTLFEAKTSLQGTLDSGAEVNQEQLIKAAEQIASLTKETYTSIAESHKELGSTISKYGKAVEKKFKVDLDKVWDPNAFEGKEATLNKALAMHFIREGHFDLATTFVQEAALDIPESLKLQFMEMYQILESIKAGSLELALNWSRNKRDELEKRDSALEFQLLKLQFIKFVVAGQKQEALSFAKAYLGEFHTRHMKDIQRLLCSVLYIKRLAKSPYADFLDQNLWFDIQRAFTRDFCQLLGLSSESPLYIAITVGTSALPTIIKMSSIMKDKMLEWTQQGELPVEIPLLDSQRFHSVLSCPVSKELATEENPPMMMVCGHVLVKESLNRLSKGNSNVRFKCPYCPSESTAAQAIRIYF